MNFLTFFAPATRRVAVPNFVVPFFEQKRFAARKGTREKRRKAHKKKVVEKTDWMPPSQRKALLELQTKGATTRLHDKLNWPPADDVFRQTYYRRIVWPEVTDATKFFRQYYHPTTRNETNSLLTAYIEFDLRLPKKSEAAMQRYLEPFGDMVSLPFHFDSNETRERPVLAFSKSPAAQEAAIQGGASIAGGVALIKDFQSGERDLNDFAYYLAHPDIAIELAALRGLMKKKYPNQRNGSLNEDLRSAATRFSRGLEYRTEKNPREPDLAVLNLPFGRLLQQDEEIEANLYTLLQTINRHSPKAKGQAVDWSFMRHVLIEAKPCKETFKLNHDALLAKTITIISADSTSTSSEGSSSDDEDSVSTDDERKSKNAVAA